MYFIEKSRILIEKNLYMLLKPFLSMNNLLKMLLPIILSILLFSCNNLKKSIKINELNNTNPIILKLSASDSTIIVSKFPNKIEIKNISYSKESFIMIDYFYNDSLTKWRNLGIELYEIDNQKLKRISNNKKKTIPSKENLEYIVYTRHFVDSTKSTQQQFKPYIKKMLAENKDTLHIGTVKEFKKNHGELFKALTKGDSISIQFLDGKKLGERVTVPVVW
jgi:hypothetical protein